MILLNSALGLVNSTWNYIKEHLQLKQMLVQHTITESANIFASFILALYYIDNFKDLYNKWEYQGDILPVYLLSNQGQRRR